MDGFIKEALPSGTSFERCRMADAGIVFCWLRSHDQCTHKAQTLSGFRRG